MRAGRPKSRLTVSATYVPGPPVLDNSNPAPANTQGVASPAASGSTGSSGSSNIGAIAGGAAAGVVALIAALVALWCCRRRRTAKSPTPFEVDETGHDTAYYKDSSAVASPYVLPHQATDRPPVDSYYAATTATPHMSMAPSMTATIPHERYSMASTMPNPHEPQYADSSRYSVQSGPTVASVGHHALPVPPSHASTSSSSGVGPYRSPHVDGKSQAGPSTAVEEEPMVHEDAGPAPEDPGSPRIELPPSYGSQRPL